MSDVENMPPTGTNPGDNMRPLKLGLKQSLKSVSKGNIGSERKKLQSLQPSGINQRLLVGSDGQLRLGDSTKKEPVKIFFDPECTNPTTPTTPKPASKETGVQVSPKLSEGSSQVEKADAALAKAKNQMYAKEDELGVEYWRHLAEKRREALETSLIENEELHTSLLEVEEEKEAAEKERDSLKEMAEQAEELAKIVKSLVDDQENDSEEEGGAEEAEDSQREKGTIGGEGEDISTREESA